MLELRDLDVYYGDVRALRGLSLQLGRSELVALIGANGAGKTTTLNTISGLLRPRRGAVVFQGRDLLGVSADQRVRMGISHVPEGRRIFGTLTVQENLDLGAYGASNRLAAKQNLARIFDLFAVLANRRKQLAGTLSGGEQQMLAIGRALMGTPKVLMLDEPSLGLAPMMVRAIAEVILGINKAGTSVLLVEQNARLALRLATRAYVIESGTVSLEGEAKSLLTDDHVRGAYLGV
ncbi:ABC transporter ATP-binding protein [bacterium]|nr:MAG: ABC transporter ATP-binding protein [bacterium]